MSPEYAAEWARKAEADAVAAAVCLKWTGRLPDQAEIVCFHSQQCAEKYLKALLAHAGLAVPRTHDLLALSQMARRAVPRLRISNTDIYFLNQYSVEIRYPGASATVAEARKAIRAANQVASAAKAALLKV